jgi:hypothetical protein
MGEIHKPTRVLLIIAASSRYSIALNWAQVRCGERLGAIALASEPYAFTETDYYTATMGVELKKQFFAFERLVDPGALADVKVQTNQWEAEYASFSRHPEPRPLNLDPGYITAAKLVLASTKDHAHRIYLSGGIYAELTLSYRKRAWQAIEWTYPDYRRADYQRFFTECRDWLLNCDTVGDPVK